MEIQEIEVTINKDGQVEVHVRGVKGEACLEITRPLEQALGGEVILREMTPESKETPSQLGDQQQLKQG
jgi:hypothetical protein